jgi:hypothetical protein
VVEVVLQLTWKIPEDGKAINSVLPIFVGDIRKFSGWSNEWGVTICLSPLKTIKLDLYSFPQCDNDEPTRAKDFM